VSATAAPAGLVIVGANGRMGQSLLRVLPGFPGLRLHAALGRPGSGAAGRDSGELAGLPANGVPVSTDLAAALPGAALVLDFSVAEAAGSHVRICAAARLPLLLGATGLGPEVGRAVDEAAPHVPILVAPNTSLGATVLRELVRRAAGRLGSGYDVGIQDLHHRAKRDAPSGTALSLGAAVLEGSRTPRPVGYASLRGGEAAGQHEVCFLGEGESLRLGHNVTDRAVFARGALRAGLWLARQAPGRYEMADTIEEK
jgi:4-hydroxy-tetrahydrodipicolinate reductase